MITLGEGLGHIPRGTHEFDRFIAPDRMKAMLGELGLDCIDVEGIAWTPTRGLHLSDDVRLNYLVAAVRT
jgi:2-polyprenyl-6-hydroxyphenyl methylase/3-demethylubiquinone-9 3-methyltransferase